MGREAWAPAEAEDQDKSRGFLVVQQGGAPRSQKCGGKAHFGCSPWGPSASLPSGQKP